MGTNYYLRAKPPCPTCGHQAERLHIGKSSAGWCFSLHVMPEDGIADLPDWEDRWSEPDAQIVDEYGQGITVSEMLACILGRAHKGQGWTPAELTKNYAVLGPAGLARSLIGGSCIGHGSGTYDLIRGEFC